MSGAGSGAGAGTGETGQASFAVPQVCINAGGWGPTSTPAAYEHVPFAPFGKSEKIGRVADITGFTKNWQRTCCVRIVPLCSCVRGGPYTCAVPRLCFRC